MLRTANRSYQIAALLIAGGLVSVGRAGARIGPERESVSLYLNVEKDGGLVTGLAPGNFRLYEDGQLKPFRLDQPEEPAAIAVLLEYSRSSGYFLDEIDAAMRGFLKKAPEDHWYALATFSHGLEINVDFTQQTGRITEAYAQLGTPTWNEIDTYDAVYEMLDKMGRLPGRRILIVIGSGVDTFSEHNMDQVKKRLESENVTIFTAGLGALFRTSYDPFLDASARMNMLQAQGFLQMLAEKSGGFAWFPRHSNAFPEVLEGIMQSVATQYRLVYETNSPGSGKFHKIKVEAFRIMNDKREDFKILVREGWR